MLSVTLKYVDQHQFVKAFAAFLILKWVEDRCAKELALYDPDWYYIRYVALFCHIYICSSIATKTVTKIFDSQKRNGTIISHFCRSDGSVAREVLKSLEK
ncbi:hypothetical protein RN001_009863 [Aquatica leii]|uniref:Uncharacterized protein n=1 Tax=Aquatica leii TaxID=1421715 RepID=A0AAN7PVT3_9COLE|nr:hypothetical protein RN001_009863 [Aquatica leii]